MKRPIKEKMAIIKELKIPLGIKETEKSKGKTMSPPPKIKNLPPGLISPKLARSPETLGGITKAKIAFCSIISFAILTICFVL